MSKTYAVTIENVSKWSVRIEADSVAEAEALALSRRIDGFTYGHSSKDNVVSSGETELPPTARKPLLAPAPPVGVLRIVSKGDPGKYWDEGTDPTPEPEMIKPEDVIAALEGGE